MSAPWGGIVGVLGVLSVYCAGTLATTKDTARLWPLTVIICTAVLGILAVGVLAG